MEALISSTTNLRIPFVSDFGGAEAVEEFWKDSASFWKNIIVFIVFKQRGALQTAKEARIDEMLTSRLRVVKSRLPFRN